MPHRFFQPILGESSEVQLKKIKIGTLTLAVIIQSYFNIKVDLKHLTLRFLHSFIFHSFHLNFISSLKVYQLF